MSHSEHVLLVKFIALIGAGVGSFMAFGPWVALTIASALVFLSAVAA